MAANPKAAVNKYMSGLDVATQGRLLCSKNTAWFLPRKIGFPAFVELVEKHPDRKMQQKIAAAYLTYKGAQEEDADYERKEKKALDKIRNGRSSKARKIKAFRKIQNG